jgi:hypothetical protein
LAPDSGDRVMTFRAPADLVKAMNDLQERDGILPSEMIRRALAMFLEAKGVYEKSERKQAATRKRS